MQKQSHQGHPYYGPVYNLPGDATLAVTTTPALGPDVEFKWCLVTHTAGAVTVTMGSTTATCNTPVVLNTPFPFPFTNPALVYFKGTGNATVSFFGGK